MITAPQIWFVGQEDNYSDKVQYSTVQACYEYLQDKLVVGIDIETTRKYPLNTYKNENIYKPGLDPYLSDVVMLQLGDLQNIWVIDTRTADISLLLSLWKKRERIWVGANLRFECKHLKHKYGIVFHKLCDVMLQEMVLTNGLGWSKINQTGYRYSLEAMAGRYLGIKKLEQKNLFTAEEEDMDTVYIDKSTRMGFLTIGDKLFTETQILYGADDIIYPLQIRELQKQGFRGYVPVDTLEIENEFCMVLADIELQGMAFNQEQWKENCRQNTIKYNNRLEKMNKWVIENHKDFCTPPDMFQPEYKCAVEWSSSKQVIKLFKKLGFCPQEKSKATKYLEYTVGAKALLKLLLSAYKEKYEKDRETDIVDQNDIILNYLLLSTAEQAVTTFGDEFLKYVHPITGRLHSTYKQILNTGRISSSNPNLQNIPQDKGYRKSFIAGVGCKFIDADYAAQESRVVAELSGDKAMVAFFNEGHPVHGDDYHSFTATKMFSLMRNEPDLIVTKKTHPEERNAAKNISFKIAYGGSAFTLKDDFGVEEEVAQEFIDSYMKAFPALAEYFDEGRKRAMENGYINMIPDRRYWEPLFEYMNGLKEKALSYYPAGYGKLSDARKAEVKEQMKIDHPDMKQLWGEYYTLKGSLERCSQNYPVQSLAGTQTKTAGILFRRHCIDNNLQKKMYLISLIHDEIAAEATDEYAEQCKQLVEKCMIDGGNIFCSKVRMDAAGTINSYWSH